ncbi:5'/3'-nucleotidase SurE [bacterium]|nr:MAG: 5'/3'-nucleotidase SurE [bacterium]
MRILITNDDGIHAPGLRALAEAASHIGEVKIAAPDRERSCCSHAMTMRDPLRAARVGWPGVEAYEVNGWPADCVNVGLAVAWPDGCDLILSGINNGPNLGFDVTYSGTAAGAMEGTINGIRSIAVSMALLEPGPIDYSVGRDWLIENWPLLLGLELPSLSFLNVNVPVIPLEEIRGHAFATMAKRVYEERIEMREDPWGRPYWWQGSVVVLQGHEPRTDVAAIRDRKVSLTPISVDWTDRSTLAAWQRG